MKSNDITRAYIKPKTEYLITTAMEESIKPMNLSLKVLQQRMLIEPIKKP